MTEPYITWQLAYCFVGFLLCILAVAGIVDGAICVIEYFKKKKGEKH